MNNITTDDTHQQFAKPVEDCKEIREQQDAFHLNENQTNLENKQCINQIKEVKQRCEEPIDATKMGNEAMGPQT